VQQFFYWAVAYTYRHREQNYLIGLRKVGKEKRKCQPVGLEELTRIVRKNSTFWDITPCNLIKTKRRFGGT
jgi:hypothetical protein